jgi:hypothetical protein
MIIQRRPQGRWRDAIEPIRLVDHALHAHAIASGREVDQRLCRARDRDPIAGPDIAQLRTPVDAKFLLTPVARRPHRNLDIALGLGPKTQQCRGTAVTENRTVSAVEDGGYPASVLAELIPADDIDAFRHGISVRHHPVLPPNQPPYLSRLLP